MTHPNVKQSLWAEPLNLRETYKGVVKSAQANDMMNQLHATGDCSTRINLVALLKAGSDDLRKTAAALALKYPAFNQKMASIYGVTWFEDMLPEVPKAAALIQPRVETPKLPLEIYKTAEEMNEAGASELARQAFCFFGVGIKDRRPAEKCAELLRLEHAWQMITPTDTGIYRVFDYDGKTHDCFVFPAIKLVNAKTTGLLGTDAATTAVLVIPLDGSGGFTIPRSEILVSDPDNEDPQRAYLKKLDNLPTIDSARVGHTYILLHKKIGSLPMLITDKDEMMLSVSTKSVPEAMRYSGYIDRCYFSEVMALPGLTTMEVDSNNTLRVPEDTRIFEIDMPKDEDGDVKSRSQMGFNPADNDKILTATLNPESMPESIQKMLPTDHASADWRSA